MTNLFVLGIESSCDDTATAIVRLHNNTPSVEAECSMNQYSDHAPFGGIVPEIAARKHTQRIDTLIANTMRKSKLQWNNINAVAASAGPGLIGGLIAAVMSAKAIAIAQNIPFIAINHLEGHALSPALDTPLNFPYLLLLVSGGHCQFISAISLGHYQRLGASVDDAPGEAFDKSARVLGLPQPGGPAIEKHAKFGQPDSIILPRPMLDKPGLNMSFAGLKTALLRAANAQNLDQQRVNDLCAAFQNAIVDILTAKSVRAMRCFAKSNQSKKFVAAGGVAANQTLRKALETQCQNEGFQLHVPSIRLCTDNAAMIAYAGALRLKRGWVNSLDTPVRARWPLDATAAQLQPISGGGRKGAKV